MPLEETKGSGPYSYGKHQTPSQVNIKPHTKGLFISVPIVRYNMSIFQQKITRGKEKQSERVKANRETRLRNG